MVSWSGFPPPMERCWMPQRACSLTQLTTTSSLTNIPFILRYIILQLSSSLISMISDATIDLLVAYRLNGPTIAILLSISWNLLCFIVQKDLFRVSLLIQWAIKSSLHHSFKYFVHYWRQSNNEVFQMSPQKKYVHAVVCSRTSSPVYVCQTCSEIISPIGDLQVTCRACNSDTEHLERHKANRQITSGQHLLYGCQTNFCANCPDQRSAVLQWAAFWTSMNNAVTSQRRQYALRNAFLQVILLSPCSGHGYKFCSVIGEIAAELATKGTSNLSIDLCSIKTERPGFDLLLNRFYANARGEASRMWLRPSLEIWKKPKFAHKQYHVCRPQNR